MLYNAIPRIPYRIQDGDSCRYMNNSPDRDAHFWNQDGCWNHNTVKGEGDNVGYDFPHKKEAIEHIKLLPWRYFLHQNEWMLETAGQHLNSYAQ